MKYFLFCSCFLERLMVRCQKITTISEYYNKCCGTHLGFFYISFRLDILIGIKSIDECDKITWKSENRKITDVKWISLQQSDIKTNQLRSAFVLMLQDGDIRFQSLWCIDCFVFKRLAVSRYKESYLMKKAHEFFIYLHYHSRFPWPLLKIKYTYFWGPLPPASVDMWLLPY